ncbi:MAG: GNAT family N-acetyltransferase [Candidatus Vogelbacteria bacterium]|nr:GNAT family N-acetyltransferase [Candidatus Vogelbacteria bacterium]
MRIRSKRYSNWDNRTKQILKNLTLSDGYMRHYVVAAPNSRTFLAYSTGGEVMGWTLVLEFQGNFEANTFVDPKWRRQGVATRLILSAARRFGRLILYYWNDENQALFYELRNRAPREIEVACWWNVQHAHEKWLRLVKAWHI